MEKTIMYLAILLRTTNVKALKLANARNPTAMGWMNLNILVLISFRSIYSIRKDNPPMNTQAGKIQTSNVIKARGNLPRLKPMSINV
jgi:hypothetical protein